MFVCSLTSIYLPIISNHTEIKGSTMKKFDIQFAIEMNPFSEFLMASILKHGRGVRLKSLYYEYKRVSNTSDSEQNLYDLAQIFYTSIKDTGMVLLRDALVLPFPKSSLIALYRVTSI